MTTQQIINAITETTPLYEDVAKLICEYNKPFTFEVGKIYYTVYKWSGEHGGMVKYYKVVKKTKCFITIQEILYDVPVVYTLRKKINYNEYHNNNEGVDVEYSSLSAEDEWKDTLKVFTDKYTGEPYVSDKPILPREPPPQLPSETPQLPNQKLKK